MGAYLSEPIRDKDCDDIVDRSRFYQVGACSMQGWRANMEDAHLVAPDFDGDPGSLLVGVFDGEVFLF